jgi:hypothetical protein
VIDDDERATRREAQGRQQRPDDQSPRRLEVPGTIIARVREMLIEPFTTFDGNDPATRSTYVVWQIAPSMWAIVNGVSCLVIVRKRSRAEAFRYAWRIAGRDRAARRRITAARA